MIFTDKVSTSSQPTYWVDDYSEEHTMDDVDSKIQRAYTLHTETVLNVIPRRLTKEEQMACEVRKRALLAEGYDPNDFPSDDTTRCTKKLSLEMSEASMKGKRPALEDAALIEEIDHLGTFLAVCDGHGVVKKDLLAKNLPQPGLQMARFVVNAARNRLGSHISQCNFSVSHAFNKWSAEVQENIPEMYAGTTATICFFEKITKVMHIMNLGDSGVYVFRKEKNIIYPVHVPVKDDWTVEENIVRLRELYTPQELEEFLKKGPKERRFPLKNGVNTTSGFGDKKMVDAQGRTALSHEPIHTQVQLEEGDLVIAACDGLLDYTINAFGIIQFIRKHFDDPKANFADLLARHALFDKQSTDNVTVISARVVKGEVKMKRQKTEPLPPAE